MDSLAGIKQTVIRLGYAKIAMMGAAAAATLALLLWISSLPLEPKSLLYSGLDPAEAAKIGQRLDELKVPFDVKGDGTTIMVPASQVARTRMELAASGLPRQGGAGYELLDQQSPMNMTSFMQRIQRLRALEGELARTIVTLEGVRTARVHIVLPERETFARDTPKATASVAVTMAGPGRLSVAQASAIRLLVSGAVPGMSAESVSVLDPSGVVIAADDSEAAGSNRISALKAAREQQLRRAVTDLLEPLIGHEKISVAAAVELDASREVSHEEKFDPLSQIERSKQTQVDQDATNETKAQDAVSVSQNLPNPNAPQGVEGGRATTNNSRSGQTVNYEISSVHSDRVREAGELRRITIAVVVDGTESDKGQYKPRSPEELERLSELIRSAVGFDANRGDRVTVETMHFVRNQRLGEGAEAEAGEFAKLPITGIAIGGAVLLIAGGVLMMRVRKSRQLALAERNPSASLPYMLSEQQSGVGQPQPGQLSALADGSSGMASSSHYALTVGRGEPALQALFGSLSEIVDARPDEALSTLRSWLAEAA